MSDPPKDVMKRYNTEQLIIYLQSKNLNLSRTDYRKFRDEKVDGSDFLKLTRDILSGEPFKFPFGPARKVAALVDDLNNQSKFYHKRFYASRVIQQTSFRHLFRSN
jgi:hypothetical protein